MPKLPDLFTDECVCECVCGRVPDGRFEGLLQCDFDLGEKLHWFPLRTDGKTNSTWPGLDNFSVWRNLWIQINEPLACREALCRCPSGQSGCFGCSGCPESQLNLWQQRRATLCLAKCALYTPRAVVHFGRHYYIHFRSQISGDYFQRQSQRQRQPRNEPRWPILAISHLMYYAAATRWLN